MHGLRSGPAVMARVAKSQSILHPVVQSRGLVVDIRDLSFYGHGDPSINHEFNR